MASYVQQIKDLENILARVYHKIYREIKKEEDYPDNLTGLKQKFNKLVYDNTRSAIQRSVILGSEKVNRIFKTEPYLTQDDLNLIKKNSDEQTDSFWRKIQLDINRKHDQNTILHNPTVGGSEDSQLRILGGAIAEVEEEEELVPPSDLDMTAYLLAVSIAALFGSFADSTLSKTSELADTIETKPKVKWVTQVDERTCDELPDSSPGCNQRNGIIYETDDPELQIHMPGSVHPFCRCQLQPII